MTRTPHYRPLPRRRAVTARLARWLIGWHNPRPHYDRPADTRPRRRHERTTS